MTTQQALEIIAEAINKAIQCNIHNKAEIVGIQQAFQTIQEEVKEKPEKSVT